ncbi:MBL fold metallo-hydrolase [Holdemanella biformis]|uniref:MBL fold metallo-hydrolase n=1 Tax=Holdemanella biformis TaxID=1735 RepID=UPI00294293E7|nr:MBL fold metallo-hydrolase [Holdemanella biformis]
MKVIQQSLGPVQANCYLVMENHHALIIDPADILPNLDEILTQNDCTLDAIVLTHAHFDHISGVDKIVNKFGCDVYLNPNEFDFLLDPDLNSSSAFYMDVTCNANAKPLIEGKNEIAGFEVEAIYCPGHSIGSTVLKIEDCLFTGDVLFQGSIGRMDLATGSVTSMKQSLKKLYQFNKDYKVYPGHGPTTSLSQEKKWNESLKYAEIY